MKKILLLSIAVLFTSLSFSQGIKMTARITAYEGDQAYSSPLELNVNSQFIRMNEYSIEGVEQESIIFNGENSDLIILSHATKEYIVLKKEEMVELMNQITEIKEELRLQMENMSPEEKDYMDQMLKSQGVNMDEVPAVDYEASGEKEKILGHSCLHYNGSVEGAKTSEVWVSSFKSLDITEEDMNGLILFTTYIKEIAEGFAAMSEDDEFNFLLHKDYEGIPLKERDYEDGKVTSEMMVVEMKKMKFDDSDFSIPSTYTEMSLDGGY